MKRFDSPAIWGVVLVVAGVLFLLQTTGVLGTALAIVWVLAFAAAGVAFLYVFYADQVRWWAIIPGLSLLGLAALIAIDEFFPALGAIIGGSLFLGAIGLSFIIVYLVKREQWWAIIPGGVLLTLAIVAGVDEVAPAMDTGWLFFLGLGGTFLVLSIVPTPSGRIKWAIIPGAVLLTLGMVLAAQAAAVLKYVWPAALILGGVYLVLRNAAIKRKE